MDAKMYLDSPTDWIDWENDDFIQCGDFLHKFTSYWNGFMASTRYHPYRLVLIMDTVKKI